MTLTNNLTRTTIATLTATMLTIGAVALFGAVIDNQSARADARIAAAAPARHAVAPTVHIERIVITAKRTAA